MPERPERKSAVIYTFPSRPRSPAEARQRDRLGNEPSPYPTVPCGSGWYHDAAIRESVPDRKP